MFNRIIISLVAITAIAGCTGQSKPVSSLDEKTATQNLFSNRPIDVVPDVYVITLNAPPLLEVGTKVNGKWEIPQAAKDLVLNEQTAFEQKLKNVASDAQVIFRYRLTLNALAVYAPANAIPAIAKFAGVRSVAMAQQMARPQEAARVANIGALGAVNPSNFIGSEHAYRAGFTGAGMRVGVLDTGIDYTHKMLGGSGVVADYKAINPDLPAASFPNAKVVGGVDLAGTAFNAASPFSPDRLPKPDANPLDEAGHGTHVAGTIVGIGDGVNGFDGVAKDATVYAVKVFGKNGSTMDAVVIAGFEFAADPNGDLNPDDQLDAINLSLGGGFGQPQILYNQAVRALSGAGTLVVASAGNSGPVDYIVGAPGTADEAISIAASIDGSEHNWRFPTVKFIAPNNPHWVAKAVEGPISKALSEIGPTEGELVDIGLADADLTDGQKAKLAGKVALISRGKVSFAEKLQRAFAGGAVGAVVYNNEPAKPFAMGGDGKVEIPAIMVSQALGLRLIEEMKVGPTRVQFKNTDILEEPELIDTITSFSSKGPRSQDNLIKPEIAAPGQMVISAAMGEGALTVKMDGTSMAAPNMTGAITLIKQAHPGLTSEELKTLAMNTAKILPNAPVTLQGAGRVQIDQALLAPVLVQPAKLSLGQIELQDTARVSKTLTVKNITANEVTLSIETAVTPGLAIAVQSQVTVPAGGSAQVPVEVTLSMVAPDKLLLEMEGRVIFRQGARIAAQVPALAMRTQASQILSPQTSVGGGVAFTNTSPNDGLALAFNLLGEDGRKSAASSVDAWKSTACDLQSAGYRVIQRATPQGVIDYIQFAVKVYAANTSWLGCEVSVLIDGDEDGIADQELAGAAGGALEGVGPAQFASLLLDAHKARQIRLSYEIGLAAGIEGKLNYAPALIDASGMAPFPNSSIALIEGRLDKLMRSADGKLNIKIAALNVLGDAVEADDYLGSGLVGFGKLSPLPAEHPYYGMSEYSVVSKAAGGAATMSKGSGTGKLILYYPFNPMDAQYQVLD